MRRRPVALIAGLLLAPVAASADTLEPDGFFDWASESVSGVSGLEVAADGTGFVAVSDGGWWIEGSFERSGGRISGVAALRVEPIIGQDGLPVAARRVGDWSDAEGLAIGADGSAWVSFERWAHVWHFARPFGRAEWIRDHPTFYDHADNWQLEAVAVDPDGVVYTISEKPFAQGFPVYRLGPDDLWTIETYLPEADVFAIVGADFDADGALYLLERKLVVGLWWQNRIRRIRLDGSEDAVLWTGERGEYGNLEGISVWRDGAETRLTLVSDNNGSGAEATQFVEFRLSD